jgi:protein-tyrosine phosphatase
MRVLMVCLGNICRSPLAEGILKHKIQERNLDIEVDSAGTGSWHVGENPDPRAIAVAKKNGVDISRLTGRQFSEEDFDRFDRILVMDESNYRNVLSLARNSSDRLKTGYLLDYVSPGASACVPDPYFGGPEGFESVYRMLDEACDRFLDQITTSR